MAFLLYYVIFGESFRFLSCQDISETHFASRRITRQDIDETLGPVYLHGLPNRSTTSYTANRFPRT